MYSLPHLGLSLASSGQYFEALEVFAEARRFGSEYRINNLLSRAIAMSTGLHLELADFETAQQLSEEARDLALSANWPPTAASASIDLLFNFARRGEIGQAERLLAEVAGAVEHAAGFHGWLWRLRLAQARAEIAVAREAWPEAVIAANAAIADSRARGRRKYEAAGLRTRASALLALGHTADALAELRAALRLARGTGDPVLFLRVASTLLALDGDDALADEARAVAARVLQHVPEGRLLHSFTASEPVRGLDA